MLFRLEMETNNTTDSDTCMDCVLSNLVFQVAFCLGLRFALEALRFVSEALRFVSEDLAFCLRRSCVLSQEIVRLVFRRSYVLSSEDLAFCLQKHCILSQKHCVLSTSKILRFVSETLRFVFKDPAFCLGSTAFYEKQFGKCRQSGIQCFNCKEFGHFAKECRKPKRVKDSAYHKEKMLLCKQAEQGVLLQAEQYDWLADTDEEIDEQELEAHYSYMAKIQEVPTTDSGTDSEPLEHVQNNVRYNVFANDLQHSEQSESISNTCLVETNDSNVILDSPDMCNDDIHNDQNDVESDNEHVALANLIANLKLDVDDNKKIQKQLKKANTTLAQELNECKTILVETSNALGKSISV
uniref:CCHC-type domain-containing protein n=1 Tax=Tanacetum cinerariifolium TaxID=118510 RepID=A0A699H6W0_TANCI|nr:hypothetical protein [Tanacetum cinerariifolium]